MQVMFFSSAKAFFPIVVRSPCYNLSGSMGPGFRSASLSFGSRVRSSKNAFQWTAKVRQLATYAIDGGQEGPQREPAVHEEAWVAPNAVVVGDVVVGPRSSIWFGATVRGDRDQIKIGEETNIQDGSVLHTDPGICLELGDRVTIGHGVMLHGCTVHSGSLIGIGATVLNKAVIGKGCLVGAGAIVTEGKVIPDGSLVIGTNKIVRQLSKAEIEGLQRNAQSYVQNQSRYRKTLKKLRD